MQYETGGVGTQGKVIFEDLFTASPIPRVLDTNQRKHRCPDVILLVSLTVTNANTVVLARV